MDEQETFKKNGLIYKAEVILKNKTRLREIRERKARQKLSSILNQRKKKNAPRSQIKRPEDFVNKYR